MRANKFIFSLIIVVSFSFGCSKKDAVTIQNNLDYKTLGTSARDMLSSEKYTSLKIEIQYMPGYQPDQTAVTNFTNFLTTLINKPGGVSVTEQQIPASGKTTLTIDDVVSIEKANRTAFTNGNQIALHILVADADYSGAHIVGISYWNTSICLFGKLIFANSGGIGMVSRTRLENIVLDHEVGHILGLVNQGSPMQVNHLDASNGMHCNNSACLMYYAIETAAVGGASSFPDLDANCRADLKANGGK